jgi:Uma2 family endonuclease
MVAKEAAGQVMSVEEWRNLERMSHDVKHEYIDGHVYAMSGGSLSHGRIGSNVVRALEDAVAAARQPCYVYNSDVAVRLSTRRYTYPDASLTCDERDRPAREKTEIEAPRLIVEVMSDSTEAYDRGRKFGYYRACSQVREYVLIATRYQAVEVYRRTAQGWAYRAYEPGEEIELDSVGTRILVDTFDRGAGVTEEADNLEGQV